MVVMVYGDVHCTIGDGDDKNGVGDNCQTFSPNCAVKLPMSPSILGKPVHVFAEDCLFISIYYYLSQELLLFLAHFFILIFRNIYQAFERDLRNLYSLSIEFSFFKAISFA